MKSHFAARLQQLREAAGLSQYALAKATGLSKQAISQLEMGQRDPAWDTVQRISLALGLSLDQFADVSVTLPDAAEPRKPGRPRKPIPTPTPAVEPSKPVEPATEPSQGRKPTRGKRKGKAKR